MLPSASFRRPFFHTILSRALQTKTSKLPQLVGPAVRALLAHYDLKTNGLRASGPKRNLLKSDVLSHINANKLSPIKLIERFSTEKIHLNKEVVSESTHPIIPSGRFEPVRQHVHVDIPLSNMRQTIARRLSQSKRSVPHAYASAFISADKIMHFRKCFSERSGLKLSLNDFIIKGCSMALRSVPDFNVHWYENSVHRLPAVDISVAVATQNGLITPILFNVDQLTLLQISEKLRELVARAREGRLRPEEFQGGTFTISNLGMFGSVSNFTAIINPPQAAILAIGGLEKHLELDEKKTPKSVSQFAVTLCYDARLIDDQMARRFLDSIKNSLTCPENLFAGMDYLLEDDANLEEMDECAIEMEIGKDDEEVVKLLFGR